MPIQVAGGFIRQNARRLRHQRPCQRHALTLAACSSEDTATPVATPGLSLSRDRVGLGAPVDFTYQFDVTAPIPADYRVLVHVVNADGDTIWIDDHNPPVPTTQWKPGQTVEYTRTIFVPSYPYVGDATMVIGLHSLKDQKRLPLTGEDAGQQAYKVAKIQLLPQTDNIFTVFKDGWHPAEVVTEGARTEWQWTKKEATIAFRNPKRDVTLVLQVDNPANTPNAASQVIAQIGDQTIATIPLVKDNAEVLKFPITAAQLGTGDMVEMKFTADKTFVPALEPAMKTGDPRELGARFFHVFIQ